AAGENGRGERGTRRDRLSRVGRILVRNRRQPRGRRRLVGLVIPEQVPNHVDGKDVAAASGEWLHKFSPSDGALLCRLARSGAEDVAAAVAAARRAQPEWAARTVVSRGDMCGEMALAMWDQRDELSEVVAAETGKSVDAARGETDAAIEMGFFMAGEGRRFYGRTTTASMEHRQVLSVRQP